MRYRPQRLVTKPLTLDDCHTLSINFRTSARGFIYVSVLDEAGEPITGYRSCELFGDSNERRVDFERSLIDLQGKSVRFCFEMSDAELFSLRFS